MNMPCGHDESNRDITVETRTVICRMCDLDDRRRDAEGREKELCAELAALRQRVAELTAQLPDGMKHCTIRFKSCPVGHGELTATNWVQHDCQVCQIRKLESTVSTLTAELIRLAAPSVPDAVRADLDRLRKCSEFGGDTPAYCVFSDGEEFRDTLMRVCRHILSARGAGDGWRPIAEAPKDGTHIIIGWQGSTMTAISRWLKTAQQWLVPTTTAPVPLNQPTHFHPMPLPLGIAAESAKEV